MERKTLILLILMVPWLCLAQSVQVKEYILDNGMKILMVPRSGMTSVAVGWVAKVGSVNERPGLTGISHLFEHMMFKGTHTIGTKDIEADLKIISDLDKVKAKIREEEQQLKEKHRLGLIEDVIDPANRSDRHNQLLEQFNELLAKQKELIVKDEIDRIYTSAGASGLNAGTSEDWTIYFINVPSNKLELWFWIESDRLLNPVFREFYSERDVVHEERRLRLDSTPIGRFEEQFNAMFWMSSPYSWEVIGWPSDLEGITREEATDYFDVNYAPNNITAVLVGDFDPQDAIDLATRYFGRLKENPQKPQPVRTIEEKQQAEKRMIAYAETNPQVKIRYHTVADSHTDEPALLLLGSILSGRTGRLYKSLVLEQEISNNAYAYQNGLKYEGYFEVGGIAKPDHTPEDVESAIYAELVKIQQEPIEDRELQKVKNQWAANEFRKLESPFYLMFQLLIYEANNGWQTINTYPPKIQSVTKEDIKRVASTYFDQENRTVAIYYTKETSTEEDSLLAGLDPDEKQQISQFKTMLQTAKIDMLTNMKERMENSKDQMPPEKHDMLEVMIQLVNEKLADLEGGVK